MARRGFGNRGERDVKGDLACSCEIRPSVFLRSLLSLFIIRLMICRVFPCPPYTSQDPFAENCLSGHS